MIESTMSESMDIAFLIVNISSTDRLFSMITCAISSIINPLMENNYDIRLALIKLNSNDQLSTPTIYPFTRSLVKFTHSLMTDYSTGNQPMRGKVIPICDVLRETFNLDWRATSDDRCHENVVFLITDGLPCPSIVNPPSIRDDESQCPCDDLWIISNQFIKTNLTLVIIGVGQFVSLCDNLYGSIAQNTGGEYIPLTNANRILFCSIQSVLTQGYTLSQSLRHIKREEFEKNSSYYNCSMLQNQDYSNTKHSEMMALKGEWLLNHDHHIEQY